MISGDRQVIKNQQGPFYHLLREFCRYWERIDVICPVAAEDRLIFDNVYLHGAKNSVSRIYQKAQEVYQRSRFEVMTVHDYPPFKHSRAALKINRKFKTPYMIEVHHVPGYPKAGDFKEWLLKIYFEIVLRFVPRPAKVIRVVNRVQTPTFLLFAGIPKSKIVYLPSFYLDKEIFQPQKLEKKYDLLFVGRLVKNKGLDLLLAIFELMKKERPEFRAAVVGEGAEKENLKLKITNLKLVSQVELLGWLPTSQALAEAYNQSKVLLITSANEGGPRVGLEALACGVPVISTDVGIMPDIIQPGKNGYIAQWSAEDFTAKIKRLSDFSLGGNGGEMGKTEMIVESVKSFDYQKMIRDYAQGIKSLVRYN